MNIVNISRQMPDASDLDRLSAGRDRVVDLVRIVSLVVVIVGHSLMLTVVTDDGRISLGNTLAAVPVLQALTWVLQIMPLFFFAGAAAATYGWRSGTTPGQWLLGRAQRLLRPLVWYLAFAGSAVGALKLTGLDTAAGVTAGLSVQLLWFLGAYLLVLAVVPLLQHIATTCHLIVAVVCCLAAAGTVDAVRLTVGPAWLGYLNFLIVWMLPAIFGIAYAKRLVTRRWAAVVAAVALITDIVLVAVGPYELSMVTVPGQQLSNMSPPTLLLAGHAVTLCALVIALRGPLTRLTMRPRLWWWVAMGNRGAMTLYLWHLPVLAAIIAAGTVLGLERDPSNPTFVPAIIAETLMLVTLMIVVTAVLSPLENRRLRWWDATLECSAPAGRDFAMLLCLVIVAASLLLLAHDGILTGWYWIVVTVAAAIGARSLAVTRSPREVAPIS
ncbi:acyltransferase family protein [Gordonia sp. VNK1]|uniref:acyltransferase family protein n=1 Tax=Gordonia oleivorans TaxID=3156618 RepID=UPI0032B53756